MELFISLASGEVRSAYDTERMQRIQHLQPAFISKTEYEGLQFLGRQFTYKASNVYGGVYTLLAVGVNGDTGTTVLVLQPNSTRKEPFVLLKVAITSEDALLSLVGTKGKKMPYDDFVAARQKFLSFIAEKEGQRAETLRNIQQQEDKFRLRELFSANGKPNTFVAVSVIWKGKRKEETYMATHYDFEKHVFTIQIRTFTESKVLLSQVTQVRCSVRNNIKLDDGLS